MDNDDITERAKQHTEAHMEIPDPTPIERIISWVKIAMATKKVVMMVWLFFFGVAGVAVKGNIDEVNPWKEAAVEVGLIEEDQIEQEATGVALSQYQNDVVLGELVNIQKDIKVGMQTITENQRLIREHTHEAQNAPHSHDLQEHTHAPPDLSHTHPVVAAESAEHTHAAVEHDHDAQVLLSSEVSSILEKAVKDVFEKEMELHMDDVH